MRPRAIVLVLALLGACGRREEPTTVASTDVPRSSAPKDTHVRETEPPTTAPAAPRPETSAITVTSSAFEQGAAIPAKHTADGQNVSPPLTWTAGPTGTVTYALVVDDPDSTSGTWVHWVIWNHPNTQLLENVPPATPTPTGAAQGKNSWRKRGYGGPQPPAGSGTHRYFFRVYALDARLEGLDSDSDRAALDSAMKGHVLASGELMGTYSRDR